MRTTRFILPLVALALCAMPAAALASSGGTTQAIIKDVAKDGKVNGHYTTGQLKTALKSPLLAQYGGQGAVEAILTKMPAKTAKAPAKATPSKATPSKATTAAPATGPTSNLPFTGADIFLFVAVGGGLVAAGLVLRRFGRRDDEAAV
jgi:hypothetical protein